MHTLLESTTYYPKRLAKAVDELTTSTELASRGLLAHDVRLARESGQLIRIRRGVYVSADAYAPLRPWDRSVVSIHAHALTAAAPPIYCFTSAARIWQLDLYRVDSAIHVARPRRRGRDQGTPVTVNHSLRYPDRRLATVNGLRTTDLLQTAADCARVLPMSAAVVLLDSVLRRGVSRQQLRDLLEKSPKARGVRRAAFAVDFADRRSESPAESRLRLLMHEFGLPAPVLQREYLINGSVYRPDFAWPEFGLVVEVHGDGKYALDGSVESKVLAERKREAALMEAGLKPLNLWWKDLDDPRLKDRLVAHLQPAIRAAGRTAGLAAS
ncbi:type IV toxin-antitoxin system AbiEi family antitoxin domain-containing protein [Zafaria sp. Z1313]|uniref:type IV toxin-antitoxin system AbiEi family antitoxin domain-containing protein n=1 Tax=unclassified Zafaria TaxID=2828765 RepID=UPI002E76C92E|nr:type IV toxin-antitoxin system AbiEi family antitoxin domain-containing protein [Zafaria sp. J156]MEE1620983.1 type IV toxin-antitoxin system AbiEi family antitoxin domain-containing protein [Zafaria sp. J156]